MKRAARQQPPARNSLRRRLISAAAVAFALVMSPAAVFAHGSYHDAATQLGAIIAKFPAEPGPRFQLARAHQEHGEWQLALAELDRVEALAPGRLPVRLVRGLALVDAGRWSAARAELDAVLAAEPAQVEALTARSRVLLQLNDPAAAERDRGRVLETTTKLGAGFFIEWANALREHQRLEPAVKWVRTGLLRLGNDPELLRLAVECEAAVGDYEAALACVTVLQKVWPRPEPWLQREAELLAAAGRPQEARAAWQRLQAHLESLPSLDRGQPAAVELMARVRRELHLEPLNVVAAPPAAR